VRGGEVDGVEPAAAEALQDGARVQLVLLHEVLVELLHQLDRRGGAVHVAHLHEADVPARLEQREVALRLVPEELRAPDPRRPLRRFLRADERARAAGDGEVELLEAVPGGGFDLGAAREAEGEEEEESGEEGAHGRIGGVGTDNWKLKIEDLRLEIGHACSAPGGWRQEFN